ncbi:MAG: hypothetical protein RML94_09055 [Bacteroidia bacterium]|nr:hypothetical protein [Bacteroidia bacterium]
MRRACVSTVRSTEAIAQPAARRPCTHELAKRRAGTRPRKCLKNVIFLVFLC